MVHRIIGFYPPVFILKGGDNRFEFIHLGKGQQYVDIMIPGDEVSIADHAEKGPCIQKIIDIMAVHYPGRIEHHLFGDLIMAAGEGNGLSVFILDPVKKGIFFFSLHLFFSHINKKSVGAKNHRRHFFGPVKLGLIRIVTRYQLSGIR